MMSAIDRAACERTVGAGHCIAGVADITVVASVGEPIGCRRAARLAHSADIAQVRCERAQRRPRPAAQRRLALPAAS